MLQYFQQVYGCGLLTFPFSTVVILLSDRGGEPFGCLRVFFCFLKKSVGWYVLADAKKKTVQWEEGREKVGKGWKEALYRMRLVPCPVSYVLYKQTVGCTI